MSDANPAQPAAEAPLGGWSAGESTWTPINVEKASPGAAGAGSDPDPAGGDAGTSQSGGRLRPSSLRGESSGDAQRRRLAPPSFPKNPFAHSQEAEVPDAGSSSAPEPTGPAQVQKLMTKVNERPEVGVGLAFAGGLLIATILKRLARR